MGAGEPRRMRNAVLVALFLIGGGVLANRYLAERVSGGQIRVVAAPGPYGVSLALAAIPSALSLPARFPNGEAVSISRVRNASVLKSVLEVFDPSLRDFLASVPIVLDSSADTAKAYPSKGYIGVSPDWDNTVDQSRYRAIYEQRGMKPDDPVFMNRFKTDLLIHELLHILQVHKGIDGRLFYEAVARWYIDPRYGMPFSGGSMVYADTMSDKRPDSLAVNRTKYILWDALYNYQKLKEFPRDDSWKNMQYGERYRLSENGVEEFAYIGQEILANGSSSENYIKTSQWCDKDWKSKKSRLSELSPEVIALFRGIFNPALMQ